MEILNSNHALNKTIEGILSMNFDLYYILSGTMSIGSNDSVSVDYSTRLKYLELSIKVQKLCNKYEEIIIIIVLIFY